MGNKTNPIGLRLILNSGWEDTGFARGADYKQIVRANYTLRTYLMARYRLCGLLEIGVVRSAKAFTVTLYVEDVDEFLTEAQCEVEQIVSEINEWFAFDLRLDIKCVTNALAHPMYIADRLAADVSNSVAVKSSVRLAAKQIVGISVAGLKASYSGRIYGVAMAQTVWHIEGRIPLHTLSADIRYANLSVKTVYGICNVKVWVCLDDLSVRRRQAQETVQGQVKTEEQSRQSNKLRRLRSESEF
ncbi:30S ribosomal protein S3 [Candidatus Hodgkinia cicadicola]|nr:30S ribosomal protein S3 [Candidatus Hodgkinia cicadicola]